MVGGGRSRQEEGENRGWYVQQAHRPNEPTPRTSPTQAVPMQCKVSVHCLLHPPNPKLPLHTHAQGIQCQTTTEGRTALCYHTKPLFCCLLGKCHVSHMYTCKNSQKKQNGLTDEIGRQSQAGIGKGRRVGEGVWGRKLQQEKAAGRREVGEGGANTTCKGRVQGVERKLQLQGRQAFRERCCPTCHVCRHPPSPHMKAKKEEGRVLNVGREEVWCSGKEGREGEKAPGW